MPEQSLLEKARAQQSRTRGPKSKHDPEQLLELGLAWFNGEIATGSQLKAALGTASGSAPGSFAFALKHAIAAGRIRIEVIK